ncbi:hypothetical protein OSB04_010800 [Centaurea solstitialis]|uniref:Plastidal glycolate/glycerate translocator 1, chloroplastic n=1 Tax=Centaurea solstitialis TaxID=347529 RepID=A0AA38TLF2_9ASTR|nr:hypothetical protein OSB04_010800 [Centaurea solstitialis]
MAAAAAAFPLSINYRPRNHHHHPHSIMLSSSNSSKYPPKQNPLNASLLSTTSTQMSAPSTLHGSSSKLTRPGSPRTRSDRVVPLRSAGSDTSITSNILQTGLGVVHLVVSLGIILAADKYLKEAFAAAAIKFPSALFGMFCIFTVLVALDLTIPAAANGLVNFFEPALLFIQRWLPLFYVPSLVVLPLAIQDIPAASGLKICFILGWLASLAVAGYAAIAVRKMVKTEMIPAEPMSKPSAFSSLELAAWGAISVASFIGALKYPDLLGTSARTCLPFLLGSTVIGYIVGTGLPSALKKVFHPIICCALAADLAAFAFGYFSKSGLYPILGYYLTKVSSDPGAGDILMGFLGSVILSFAFSMFKQRKLVKRHAAEIFTSITIATLFSLYSTAFIGRLVGLEPTLTISILPRCITVALALSIVSLFEGANSSLTAAAVVLTGLIGANFVQAVLDKLKFDDPIARGIATASRVSGIQGHPTNPRRPDPTRPNSIKGTTMWQARDLDITTCCPRASNLGKRAWCTKAPGAHGLGTAALSAKEPEALPFCAIAYGLTGIFGSLVCSVPAVRQSLLAIVG